MGHYCHSDPMEMKRFGVPAAAQGVDAMAV